MNPAGAGNKKRHITSRVAMLAIFLALIRCISEPLRLQYYSTSVLSVNEIRPFLYGALVCAAGLLLMVLLWFYARHKWVTVTAMLVILLLLVLKWQYSI